MNKGEKFVFGVLSLSVGAGLMDMATSPWSIAQPQPEKRGGANSKNTSVETEIVTKVTDDDMSLHQSMKDKEVVKFSD